MTSQTSSHPNNKYPQKWCKQIPSTAAWTNPSEKWWTKDRLKTWWALISSNNKQIIWAKWISLAKIWTTINLIFKNNANLNNANAITPQNLTDFDFNKLMYLCKNNENSMNSNFENQNMLTMMYNAYQSGLNNSNTPNNINQTQNNYNSNSYFNNTNSQMFGPNFGIN